MRLGGYTPEQIQWLRDNAPTMSVKGLWRAFNQRFAQLRTLAAIKSTMKREGIRNGRPGGNEKGKRRLFTQAQADFIRYGYQVHTLEVLTERLNEKFDTAFTLAQVRAFTRNHSLKSGRTGRFVKGGTPFNKGVKGWQAGGRSAETRFKKGCMLGAAQHNYVPIGTTRVTKDGYIERKVTDDPNLVPARRWVAEHRLIWEAANGPIPAGHVVVFLDADKRNLALDNLRCVPRGVLQWMNKSGLSKTEGEARKAAILTAEVVTMMHRRARG